MRRSDRQITDIGIIDDVFERAKIVRIGFIDEGVDGGQVYLVPVNYGYEKTDSGVRLYFHGAKAGRKYELALANPRVGLELDVDYQLVEGPLACNYGALYRSIIGNGRLCVVNDRDEALHGLSLIMDTALMDPAHRGTTHMGTAHMDASVGAHPWEFSPEIVERTAVFRLDVDSFTCKSRGK